jgi:hypothetical protein
LRTWLTPIAAAPTNVLGALLATGLVARIAAARMRPLSAIHAFAGIHDEPTADPGQGRSLPAGAGFGDVAR